MYVGLCMYVAVSSGHSLGQDWRRRPGRPCAYWKDQRRKFVTTLFWSLPGCQSLETSCTARPRWSDATARAGYATTTTTTSPILPQKFFTLVPVMHFDWEGPNTAVKRPVERLWRLVAQTTLLLGRSARNWTTRLGLYTFHLTHVYYIILYYIILYYITITTTHTTVLPAESSTSVLLIDI